MAEIRLNKLTKQFNIGLQTLVDFLNGKGAEVEMNPNAKVSDEFIPELEKAFGGDVKAKEDSERVQRKIKEIIEKGSKKKEDEEDEPAGGNTVIIRGASGGTFSKGESDQPAEQKQEAAHEPENVHEAAPVQKPEQPEAKPVEAAPAVEAKVEEVKLPEPQPESVHVQVEAVAAPVVIPEEKPEVKAAPEKDVVVDEPSVQTPSEQAHASQFKKSDMKKSDRMQKEFNPKADKAKLKAEHKLQKAASSSDADEPATSSAGGLKIVGKVDLSKFETRKNKKRERIAKGGSQKVDVNKIDNDDNRKDGGKKNRQGGNSNNGSGGNGGNGQNGKKDFRQNGNGQQGGGKNRRKDRNNDRFKPAMTEAEQEEMQKEIQKQVKETYARMNDSKSKNNFGAKHRKEKRELASQKLQEEMAQEAAEKKILKVTEFVTVNDLATLMNTPVNKVIEACFSLGLMVSINQRLDAEALVLVAEEFGYKVEFVTADIQNEINQDTDEPENEADLVTRPPIITVMGHVDHGKTSLLDYIRQTNVIAGEAGGITQHIGAYNVVLHDGRRITFLDTPGHEAFTAMRARGAQLTDLAIIIIAADDAVMPQTVEAINHAQAAGVPMVFAINKIDKPGAQPEKIRQQLAQMNILVEDWGGKYQCQEISAKKGLNVDKLLEKVLLETDLMDLKANPKKLGVGTVIESSLDKGRGYLATILVQDGTVHTGDMMLSGCYYGRVKAMFNERGQKVEEAGPSTPVSILGLNGAPSAGDKFNIMNDEKEAKAIANKREQLIRIQGIKKSDAVSPSETSRN